MKKVAFIDFHGTLAYKSYSDTLHQVLGEFHPDHLYTQSTFRDLLDGSYLWDNPQVEHKQLNKSEKWWEYMNGKLREAYVQLGYKEDADQMTARFRELYTDPNEYMVYDDAVEGVQKIRKMGWKVVVLTNHMPEVKKVIKKLPFGRYISRVICSANIGYEKPNIKFYEYALKKTWNPKKRVMLGDNILADVQGATSVGIPSILVRNLLFKDNENCKHYAKDLHEAVDIIAKYF